MAQGKVIIYGENRVGEATNSAKKDILGFGEAADSVGKKLEQAFTVTAIALSLKKLGEVAFECFTEFGEGERRLNTLKIALDNNEGSLNKATRLIDDMRKVSLSSKDDIESLVGELAQLGKSDKDIELITKASVNLSNVTGKDLQSSFQLINATYDGSAGKLSKLIPEIGNLTKEQLASGQATEIINQKFGAMSDRLAENDIPQKLKNLKDGFEDLKENAGERAAAIFNPLIDGLNKLVEGWNNAYEAQKRATKDLLTEVKFHGIIWDNKDNKETIGKTVSALVGTMTRDEYTKMLEGAGKIRNTFTPKQEANYAYAQSLASQFQTSIAQAPSRVSLLDGANGSSTSKKVEPEWMQVQRRVLGVEPVAGSNSDLDAFLTKIKGINNDLVSIGSITQDQAKKNVVDEIYKAIESLVKSGEFKASEDTITYLLGKYNEEKTTLAKSTDNSATDSWTKHYQALGNAYFEDKRVKSLDFRTYESEEMDTSNSLAIQTAWEKTLNYKPNTSDEDDAANFAALDRIAENLKAAAQDKEVKDWITADNLNWFNQQTTPKFEFDYTEFDKADAEALDALDRIAVNNQNWYDRYDANDAANLAALDVIASHVKPLDVINSSIKSAFYGLKESFSSVINLKSISATGLDRNQILDSLGSSFGELTTAIQPLTQIIFSANPLMAALIPIISSLVTTLSPILTEMIAPIMDALSGLGTTIAEIILPIFEALSPSLSIIGNLITTIFTPILQILAPIFQVLASVLQVLNPILVLLAQAFTILMAPIEFIADLFGWLGQWIMVLGTNIGVFIYNLSHWLNPKDYVAGAGAFSSDAFTGLAEKLDAIANIGSASYDLTADNSTTGGSSANYTGGNTITINIYQGAPIVGDGGMNEFATMIRDKFLELDYYNA